MTHLDYIIPDLHPFAIPIDSVHLDPANAMGHDAANIDQIAGSLAKHKQRKPIVINRATNVIEAGNGTLLAARQLGWTHIAAVGVEDTAQMAVSFGIADNAVASQAWDWTRLKTHLDTFDDPASIPGVDTGLLDLLDQALAAEADADGGAGNAAEPEEVVETEAEKLAKEYGVEEGQIWQLGRHTIVCLNSLDAENIKRLIGNRKVGLIWADPPYGINIVAANVSVGGGEAYDIPFGGVKNEKSGRPRRGYVGGGQRIKDLTGRYPIEDWTGEKSTKRLGSLGGAKPFGSKNSEVRGSVGAANLIEVGKYAPVIGDETTETAKQSFALLYDLYTQAVHIWWGGNYYTDVLPPSPGWIVWDKDNTGDFADCELAWTNQDKAAKIFEHRWNGMLKASEHGQRRVHPTQKPVALAMECFREYGTSNNLILDPFLGSGISVLAAEQLDDDRQVIGFELAPAYIGVTLHRWETLTGQKAVRE